MQIWSFFAPWKNRLKQVYEILGYDLKAIPGEACYHESRGF